MLAQKIKQIADRIRDPHATLQSVAAPLGSWHYEDGDSQCDLVLHDKDFQDGTVSLSPAAAGSHLAVAARQPAFLLLSLAKDAVLTVTDLERLFGKAHPVPPPPSGNPYSVAFYPSDSLALSTAIVARLSGPPEKSTTHVTSLLLRRDDARAVTTDKATGK